MCVKYTESLDSYKSTLRTVFDAERENRGFRSLSRQSDISHLRVALVEDVCLKGRHPLLTS